MKKNNTKKDIEKSISRKSIFNESGAYIKKNYMFLLLFFFGVLAVSALNFMKISTSETIASFNIKDFEVGMIADRNIIADRSLSPDELEPISVIKGERIIKKGWPITEEGYAKLRKMSASPLYIDYRAFANNELYIVLLAILWYLLFSFMHTTKKLLFREPLLHVIFFIIVYAITAFCGKFSFFANPYSISIVIPTALFIMLVTILYGNSSAVLLSIIISLGVLNASGYEIPTFLFTIASSLCSCAIVHKIERRLDLVFAGLILAVVDVVFMLLMLVIFNETFEDLPKLIVGIVVNGFISGILTLGFLTPMEIILNTASVFRLMDLSDTNTPIFKQMQILANGTYNHSMMVSQLAESACREIDANPLIARVGGYFHDLGKIDQSEYFVENQQGMENKHNEINPNLSALVIKSHVKKGVEKAHQLHLPQAVIDIIAEHHGNSVITYFYNAAKEKDPTVSPEDFTYPGTPPSTRESGVVMLADTVEAACHTLDNPTSQRLEKFIDMLISQKVEHGQLDYCELTFRDISRIKESFVNLLTGYYHNRIKYQNQQDPDKEEKETENKEKDSKENTEKDSKEKEPEEKKSKESKSAKTAKENDKKDEK